MKANGQTLNVHHGEKINCKSCEKEQWEVCWNLSDDYLEYQEEGEFSPSVWNERHIEIEEESRELEPDIIEEGICQEAA
jgi:hypothetical protein